MALTLSIGSYSLTLKLFTPGGGYDRYPIDGLEAAVEYSMTGVPVVDGPAQEPPLFWQVTAQMNQAQMLMFQRIRQEQNRKRYTPPFTGYAVRLVDGNRPWVEPTQARLNSGSVLTVTEGVQYTACFDVWLLSPKISTTGKVYETSFTMAELGRVPPA